MTIVPKHADLSPRLTSGCALVKSNALVVAGWIDTLNEFSHRPASSRAVESMWIIIDPVSFAKRGCRSDTTAISLLAEPVR